MDRNEYARTTPPLDAPVESIHKHDPRINFAFNAIFEHPDNAEITRAITVGLPINDPPKPVEEEATPATAKEIRADAEPNARGDLFSAESGDPKGFSFEGIRFKDTDGDEIKVCYVVPNDGDVKRERITLTVNGVHAVALTLAQADDLADWLDAALSDEDEPEGASA